MKINDIVINDEFEGTYVVRDSSLQTAKNGKKYIRFEVSDASGSTGAQVWDGAEEVFSLFKKGDFVKVRGNAESYNNKLVLRVISLCVLDPKEVDLSEFVPRTPRDVNELIEKLQAFIGTVSDDFYKKVLDTVFDTGDELWERFLQAPAASKNHHNYIGGLLEHTVDVTNLAYLYCETTSLPINKDLLITGALLHDIGKVDAYNVKAMIDYSDDGMLMSHIPLGVVLLTKKITPENDEEREKFSLLSHLVISHHGRLEWGSPVLPVTKEALALHHLDCLDALPMMAQQCIDKDKTENKWTDYYSPLSTRIRKT